MRAHSRSWMLVFIWYIFAKYVFPLCSLPIRLLNTVFEKQQFLPLMKFHLSIFFSFMVSVVCVLSEKSLSIPSSQRHSSICSCVSVISHIPSSCSLLELVVLPYACAACIWLKGSPLQISATPALLRSLYPAKSSQFSNFNIWSLFPEPQQVCCSLSGLLPCCSLKSLLKQKSRANMKLTSCLSFSQRSKPPCFVYCFQPVTSCILCHDQNQSLIFMFLCC